MKNSTKCETVARIQDTQAAELWDNVANCDGCVMGWSTSQAVL